MAGPVFGGQVIFPTVDAHNEGDRKLPHLVGNGVGKNKKGLTPL
jgi:hypothetical protein